MRKSSFSTDCALIGIMAALLTTGKMVLSFIPNIEIVSFMIIIFARYFGKKTLFAVFTFILIEGVLYGFNIWWLGYVYTWPLLCLLACIIKARASRFSFTVLSTLFGFSFGLFYSVLYVFAGSPNPGIGFALSWWIAGIPFDLIHGAGNLAVMLCLYKPVTAVMDRLYEKK